MTDTADQPEVSCEFITVPVNDVMKYYADAFKGPLGTMMRLDEWFFDPTKGTVIFKFTVEELK